MKKFILIFLIAILALNPYPANGLFGLSKCEKARKAIQAEETIGSVLWNDFRDAKKGLTSQPLFPVPLRKAIAAMEQLKLVYKSDDVVFRIVKKNAKCFSAKEIAYSRTKIAANKQYYTVLNRWKSSISKGNRTEEDNTPDNLLTWIRAAYPNYASFLPKK
jgi:hypothetical protein